MSYTVNQLRTLNEMWHRPSPHTRLNWLELEDALAEALGADNLTDAEKVALSKEYLDAFTRRGHFDLGEYTVREMR